MFGNVNNKEGVIGGALLGTILGTMLTKGKKPSLFNGMSKPKGLGKGTAGVLGGILGGLVGSNIETVDDTVLPPPAFGLNGPGYSNLWDSPVPYESIKTKRGALTDGFLDMLKDGYNSFVNKK